ncbi:MAG: glycosyltransferase family 2 protein [Litorimonas sp.]
MSSLSTKPDVSVIIVNYNAGEHLRRCIESVATQTLTNFDCIILDNGSTDGSLGNMPELDDRFKIIEAGENLGFSLANNRAVQHASADWIALLNPDAFAHADWLEKGLAARTYLPKTAMIGSTQYLALETNKFDGLGDEYHAFGVAWRAGFSKPVEDVFHREAFGPCGAGAFYDRSVFQSLGGFDESFFCYHEDVDLAFRMRLAGYRCVQSADAKIDHISSAISGRASEFAVYHGTRNRIWTFFNNMPGPLLILLTIPHILSNVAFLLVSLNRKGRFKSTFRGMRHGFFTRPKSRPKKVERSVSLLTLVNAMGWNPLTVVRRAPVKTERLVDESGSGPDVNS